MHVKQVSEEVQRVWIRQSAWPKRAWSSQTLVESHFHRLLAGRLAYVPYMVHSHEMNVVLVGHMLETVGDGGEVAAPPAHVVDVGLNHDVIYLN